MTFSSRLRRSCGRSPTEKTDLAEGDTLTSEPRRSAGIRGSLRSEAGRGFVRIEGRYDTDIDDLWSAITNPVRLARWYAKVEGDLLHGGKFSILVESDDWEGTGRVEACEAPRRLVVTTRESDESWRK